MQILKSGIQIEIFQEYHQPEVELLLENISKEFSEPISTKSANRNPLPPDHYLVAVCENKVVGTISITRLDNGNSVLRKMFLHKNYRGQGIADFLLHSIVNWAVDNNQEAIYLGTMTQFSAAQKFYEKHHFKKVIVEHLPQDFPINPIDNIFYRLDLNHVKP